MLASQNRDLGRQHLEEKRKIVILMEAVMGKQSNRVLMALVVAALLGGGTVVGRVFAQGKAAVTPAPSRQQLRDSEVNDLVLLMDTDKNGKISKKEWMTFFEAEFDRLDVDKNGELDPHELKLSRVRVTPPASVGK